jgi:predicted SnoaL-like aldol condensation-catalyzing enzyme
MPTNSDVLRGYFKEIDNQKKLDRLSVYVSEQVVGHNPPYVGLGVINDDSDGKNIIVRRVNSGGPADGKLQVGDVIVRVMDGGRTFRTYQELRSFVWGQGVLGTPVTLWVQRGGVEHEITIKRGLVQGLEGTFQFWQTGMPMYFKEWPDLHTDVIHVVEAGDLVAYYCEHQGHNSVYGRSAVWEESGIVRIQNGKITDWWSTENTLSQMKQLGYTLREPETVKE